MHVHEYPAPVHWACYLFNGEPDGMDARDIAACDAWLERINLGAPVSMDEPEDNLGFCHGFQVALLCPEAPALGCDLANYQFLSVTP